MNKTNGNSSKVVICPYCGETQRSQDRCRACLGLFEPLSQQATLNAMGPWFVRDPRRAFHPGCSYETLVNLIDRGEVTRLSIIRGPTTRQLWNVARRVQGVAHLFGYCHACQARVEPDAPGCPACGVMFGAFVDRDYLGLPDIRPLPWEANVSAEAQAAAHPAAIGPGRLSSFATNDELRGRTVEPAVPAPPREAPSAYSRPAAVAAASPLDSGPRTRSLERRLAQQTRTIRTLGAVIALGAISLVTLVVILAGGLLEDFSEPPPPVTPVQRPAPETDRPVIDETPPPAIPETNIEPEPIIETTIDQTPAAPAIDVAALQAEAREHAARAEDESLELDGRIAATEAALAVLDRIEREADAAEHPSDLAAQRTALDQLLEHLRLRAFFP